MQSVRPELHEVSFRSASCLNTLFTALGVVSDQNDFVIVSEMTSLLMEEASSDEIKGSSLNVLEADAKDITSSAKRLQSKLLNLLRPPAICYLLSIFYLIFVDLLCVNSYLNWYVLMY